MPFAIPMPELSKPMDEPVSDIDEPQEENADGSVLFPQEIMFGRAALDELKLTWVPKRNRESMTRSSSSIGREPPLQPTDGPAHDAELADSCFKLSDAGLLRGVKLSTLLQSRGQRLVRGKLDDAIYLRSKQVDALDAFVSHNWDVPRLGKFLALVIHYGYAAASFSTLLLMAGIVGLDAIGLLPYWSSTRVGESVTIGPWNSLLATPFYWAIIIYKPDIIRLLGLPDSRVFFDSMCINQCDGDAEGGLTRKAGINAIPAIVARSRRMVSVLTPVYLTRIWTMLEMMCFMAHNSRKQDVHFEPAVLAKTSVLGSAYIYAFVVVYSGFQYVGSAIGGIPKVLTGIFLAIPFAVATVLFVVNVRAWGRELDALVGQARAFDFGTALCAVESDRGLLKEVAACLPKYSQVSNGNKEARVVSDSVDPTFSARATQSQSTSICNRELAADLELTLMCSIGRCGVPFRYLVGFLIPALAFHCDVQAGIYRQGVQGLVSVDIVLCSLLRGSINFGLFLATLTLICHLQVHYTRKARLTAAVSSVVACVMCVLWTYVGALYFLPSNKPSQNGAIVCMVVLALVIYAFCWFMHRPAVAMR